MLVLSTDIAAAKAARRHEGPQKGEVEHTNEAQKAAERWKERYAQGSSPSIEEVQRQGREAWLKLREASNAAPEQQPVSKKILERDAASDADKQKGAGAG